MKSAYFRELKRYTKTDIATALHSPVEDLLPIIQRLKSLGIIKAIKATPQERRRMELYEEDLEISDVDIENSSQLFVVDYVGVITIENFIFICYPKYISTSSSPLKAMRQILQILRKYSVQEKSISIVNGTDEKHTFNMLAIILFAINDYCEHGVYSNQQDITEINGEGEIDWDKTVNETYTVINQNRPYYLDIYTKKSIDDENDYFHRLHRCIVTECSKKLMKAELNSLFGLDVVLPYDGEISDFGEDEYIMYRLRRELNVQFASRKQILLRTMYAYVSHRRTLADCLGLSLYGTNSFNLVWEKVCSEVFGNLLNTQLSHLPIQLAHDFVEQRNRKLVELIEKPKWSAYTETGIFCHSANDTLIPDIVTIYSSGGVFRFGIFDAKYYNIKLDERKIEGHPGVGDITKQYLYQLAFKDFIHAHSFEKIQNAFLFPSESNDFNMLGEVEMTFLHTGLDVELQNILIIKLSAPKMYKWYMNGKKIDITTEFAFL